MEFQSNPTKEQSIRDKQNIIEAVQNGANRTDIELAAKKADRKDLIHFMAEDLDDRLEELRTKEYLSAFADDIPTSDKEMADDAKETTNEQIDNVSRKPKEQEKTFESKETAIPKNTIINDDRDR